MPRKFTSYEPDAIDCDNLVRSLAEDFGVTATVEVSFALDKMRVIARCRKPALSDADVPLVQAIVTRPIKSAPTLYTPVYSALTDCWHQLDRGALAVATSPITRRWDGRPELPRRRTAD